MLKNIIIVINIFLAYCQITKADNDVYSVCLYDNSDIKNVQGQLTNLQSSMGGFQKLQETLILQLYYQNLSNVDEAINFAKKIDEFQLSIDNHESTLTDLKDDFLKAENDISQLASGLFKLGKDLQTNFGTLNIHSMNIEKNISSWQDSIKDQESKISKLSENLQMYFNMPNESLKLSKIFQNDLSNKVIMVNDKISLLSVSTKGDLSLLKTYAQNIDKKLTEGQSNKMVGEMSNKFVEVLKSNKDLQASIDRQERKLSNLGDQVAGVTQSNKDLQEKLNSFNKRQDQLIDLVNRNLDTMTKKFANVGINHYKTFSSCAEVLGNTHDEDGVYEIDAYVMNVEPFKVFCQKSDDNKGAWTVILRRQDGSVDFYRDWESYKNGFGFLKGEHFLGLEKVHHLTNGTPHELQVLLEDFEGGKRYAKYDKFIINNENTNYTLAELGTYSGTAGDSLRYHVGKQFSTKDRDNDFGNGSCATQRWGAWWYHDCYQCHLTGSYLHGTFPESSPKRGVTWNAYRGHFYSLKYAAMMIRPRK